MADKWGDASEWGSGSLWGEPEEATPPTPPPAPSTLNGWGAIPWGGHVPSTSDTSYGFWGNVQSLSVFAYDYQPSCNTQISASSTIGFKVADRAGCGIDLSCTIFE